ncbi:MAG: RidA family protein [Pseudomonadota bacterium]
MLHGDFSRIRRYVYRIALMGSMAAIVGTTAGCTAQHPYQRESMDPPGRYASPYYTHAVATRGGKTLYVSGQWSYDPSGKLVGRGDLKAQTIQAFTNLKAVVEAAGARTSEIVKINTYVVGYEEKNLAELGAGLNICFGTSRDYASTVVGVQSLAREGMLIEVEAIVVTR